MNSKVGVAPLTSTAGRLVHFLSAVAFTTACCVFAGCQSTRRADDTIAIPQATAPTSSRFTAVHEIVLKIDSSVTQLPRADGFPIMPRFPHSEQRDGNEAFPIVAYVIDTTGRIEPRTLTFLVTIEPAFAVALCNWAQRVRFTPMRDSTGARRALAVQPFAFEMAPARRGAPDAEPYHRRLLALGPVGAFAYLDELLHCGSVRLR